MLLVKTFTAPSLLSIFYTVKLYTSELKCYAQLLNLKKYFTMNDIISESSEAKTYCCKNCHFSSLASNALHLLTKSIISRLISMIFAQNILVTNNKC